VKAGCGHKVLDEMGMLCDDDATLFYGPKEVKLAEFLKLIQPGERVHYRDWRGGSGEGVFLRHIDGEGKTLDPKRWGYSKNHGVVVKRDFSSDDGRVFRPFAGDGDVVLSHLMIVEHVMES
jgi:hypothetical protein